MIFDLLINAKPMLAFFLVDDAIYIYLAIAAAAAAYSYDASQKSAKAQEQAGAYQQQAADQQAKNQELTAMENIRRERTNKKRRLARMHTGIVAGSGLVMEGSLEDAFTETAGLMELEIQDSARAAKMEAANTRSAGDLALWESRVQSIATRNEATGSLLSSAASMTGAAYNAGAFGSKKPATTEAQKAG